MTYKELYNSPELYSLKRYNRLTFFTPGSHKLYQKPLRSFALPHMCPEISTHRLLFFRPKTSRRQNLRRGPIDRLQTPALSTSNIARTKLLLELETTNSKPPLLNGRRPYKTALCQDVR